MPDRIVTTETTATRPARSGYSAANTVYVIFGILEALLAFRLVFLLLGANRDSGFVSFIYGVTEVFV